MVGDHAVDDIRGVRAANEARVPIVCRISRESRAPFKLDARSAEDARMSWLPRTFRRSAHEPTIAAEHEIDRGRCRVLVPERAGDPFVLVEPVTGYRFAQLQFAGASRRSPAVCRAPIPDGGVEYCFERAWPGTHLLVGVGPQFLELHVCIWEERAAPAAFELSFGGTQGRVRAQRDGTVALDGVDGRALLAFGPPQGASSNYGGSFLTHWQLDDPDAEEPGLSLRYQLPFGPARHRAPDCTPPYMLSAAIVPSADGNARIKRGTRHRRQVA
jgi:hypothetical protein